MPNQYRPAAGLLKIMSLQTSRSGITGVDLPQYAAIAEWLCNRYGDPKRGTIPVESLQWLQNEAGFKQEQLVKATYIALLLLDFQEGRVSEPCPEFRISCPCGRMVSRKSSDCHRYPMYRCQCGRAVGFHKGDGWPLGLLASREVRRWRGRLHDLFSQLSTMWGCADENASYPRLAELLNINVLNCHFALLDSVERAIEIQDAMLAEIARINALSAVHVSDNMVLA